MTLNDKPHYQRVLLKLSGEALLGELDYGIDPKVSSRIAREVAAVVGAGVQIGIVIGGGNIFRGKGLAASGIDRITGDHMGMLATVMNALALQDALEKAEVTTRVMSAVSVREDRKSTRLNSSHVAIAYAVFCLDEKAAKPSPALGG